MRASDVAFSHDGKTLRNHEDQSHILASYFDSVYTLGAREFAKNQYDITVSPDKFVRILLGMKLSKPYDRAFEIFLDNRFRHSEQQSHNIMDDIREYDYAEETIMPNPHNANITLNDPHVQQDVIRDRILPNDTLPTNSDNSNSIKEILDIQKQMSETLSLLTKSLSNNNSKNLQDISDKRNSNTFYTPHTSFGGRNVLLKFKWK